ncbi:protein Aatf [Scaptodrosophila lebanonensis]|uniref:Protein Aatf n=1 Tax=Drosophila lebanonensis TaxID=7225 RepID=A0A6J2TZS2_DROLE|nr:protein Aatf [Scaptodrosophila lebanonensis]
MLRKTKKQPQTVAEKVSKLLAHPNDSESDDNSDADLETAAKVVDFEPDEYDLPDARSTDFRKRNVKLLSEQSARYKGKIASRKEFELEEDEEADEDEDEDSQEDEELGIEESDSDEEESTALAAFNRKLKSKQGTKAEQSESDDMDLDEDKDDDDDDEEGSAEGEEDDSSEDEEEGEDDASESAVSENDDDTNAISTENLMSKTNQQAEIQKGLCVQNQLRIWERLLELRMNTQKVTSKANQLPPPQTLPKLGADNEGLQTVLQEAQERSNKLLQQLLLLQHTLAQQFSELRRSVKRKQPPPERDDESPCKRFAGILQNNFQEMRVYRNEVLLKWDDRTKLLTPGAGTKRKSVQEDYDIIKKIDNALGNREVLIEKSQILKSNQDQTAAESAAPQRQPHIYDDSDFYHQQLRELIEYKASTSANMSDLTKQFVELQKLRQKMKKKVDTRASKGRKLRYVVHNKLVNFMAPNEASDWTEDSKAELYRSLFV